MLGALYARSTAITKPSSFYHRSLLRRSSYSSSFSSPSSLALPPAVAIWNAALPSLGGFFGPLLELRGPGEGSWNVAWDVRLARWLHRPYSGWFLFGVCGFVEPITSEAHLDRAVEEAVAQEEDQNKNRIEVDVVRDKTAEAEVEKEKSSDYRVTGVLADGRCLFRAIAHYACLRKGEEALDDNSQRELADKLRAQLGYRRFSGLYPRVSITELMSPLVVEELIKRREETEWFIEGDFDAYIRRIQEPYVWGGEPELLMASHVLQTPIWVYMVESSSGILANITKYGEEYHDYEETPISILFHGYGHYEILESLSKGC